LLAGALHCDLMSFDVTPFRSCASIIAIPHCETWCFSVQTVYAPIPDNRHLDHGLGLGSGCSFGSQHQGSGQLPIGFNQGSGHLPFSPSQSGQFGVSPRQSGHLSTSNSQGSGQLLGQLLGQNRSGSLTGAASWQGAGQIGGSPHLTGAGQIGGESLTGQARSESPFAQGQYSQPFQSNEGEHSPCSLLHLASVRVMHKLILL